LFGVLFGGIAALSLGVADYIGRSTSRALGPRIALFYVLAVAAAAFTAYALSSGTSLGLDGDKIWLVLASGIAYCVALLSLYAALALGPVAVAAPIAASHPALVVAVLVPLGIVPSWPQWAGIAITILGVLLISGAGNSASPARPVGRTVLLACLSSVAFSVHFVTVQEALAHYTLVQTIWAVRVVAFLVGVAFVLRPAASVRIPRRWWPAVAGQGALDLLGTAMIVFGSIGTDRAIVVVIASTFAGVTVVMARVLLREMITSYQWAAITMILAGCVILASVDQ